MPIPSVKLFPFLFQPKSGEPIAAEKGLLTVLENRSATDSQTISIPFIRFKCRSKTPRTPIVFLQGGPGESVLPNLPEFWSRPMWKPNLDIADFIFIEQRGFGLALPCLQCPGVFNLPLDEPGSAELRTSTQRQYLSDAAEFWQAQGVDPVGYNVHEMASDIDDLRRMLGYEKISLLGGSFGTHHALALLRYYSQFIERAFLFSVEGPDHTIKLPGQVQKQLELYSALCADDPKLKNQVPDLLDLMSSLLHRLDKKPLTLETKHPLSNETTKITMGKNDLQWVTANGLGNTRFISSLPRRFLEMAAGDYAWLAEQVIGLRVNQKDNLMYALTDCASGASANRRRQVALDAPATLLGNAINDPFHEFCADLGGTDLGDEFRSELSSDKPIILTCGSLDARTPISNAAELLPGLPNGQLISIEGVAHDLSVHGDHVEELTRLRDCFFRAEDISSKALQASFSFQTITA